MKRLIEAIDVFLREATRVDRERAVGPIQDRLEAAMQDAFRAQKRALSKLWTAVGELIPDEFDDDDWEPWFDEAAEATAGAFVIPILAAASAGLAAGAKRALADIAIDISFDLANPRAVAYLEAHGAELVTNINDTTRDYIKTVVTQGVSEGWSYDRIADAITDRYEDFAVGKPQEHIDSRAHLIAVTEAGEAYSEGNRIVIADLKDGGLEMQKSWLTVGDNRVSDGCQENQDAGWIPFDEPFPSGDQRPLRFPGCRCDCLYRRKPAAQET